MSIQLQPNEIVACHIAQLVLRNLTIGFCIGIFKSSLITHLLIHVATPTNVCPSASLPHYIHLQLSSAAFI